MSKPIIQSENIGKAYKLGQAEVKHDTFRDAVLGTLKAPLRRLRSFGKPERDEELFWALRNVSFSVAEGDVVGVIGRNGAGKSTLLKILSRITEPTEGQVALRGRVASLLEVGTGFHPELTGRENIYLNGSILGMTRSEIDRKFDEIVAFSEIERFLDTPVKRFSSGMYVRLAFAVAAHLEPEILIVDEVLAVGDFEFQKKCLGKMQDVAKHGRTVIFVSHQISAINRLCRRVIWLDKGRIVGDDVAPSVVARYLSQGLSDAPEITLPAPGDNVGFFFTKIAIKDGRGFPSTELDALSPFSIGMHYEVTVPITGVEMSVRVKTSDGVPVFTTVYSDHSDISRMDKMPGSHIASVQIPGHFLMPGTYSVNIAAYRMKGGFELLRGHENVARFTVTETGTKLAKYSDKKDIGVVIVNFPWSDQAQA
jgi:lipopolysaccharide transport system ATP-binding protein